MRNLLTAIALVLIAVMTTSVIGAAITENRSEPVNTMPGEISNEELRVFFNENRELLQSIAAQMIPLHETLDLHMVRVVSSDIRATNGNADQVILPSQLQQQIELYYNIIGTANTADILVREIFLEEHLVVEFTFRLPDGLSRGIMYSLDYQREGWEQLAENWQIFEWQMPGPPIVVCWYENLPGWLHWIFRWVFFGWVWMCCPPMRPIATWR